MQQYALLHSQRHDWSLIKFHKKNFTPGYHTLDFANINQMHQLFENPARTIFQVAVEAEIRWMNYKYDFT